MLIDGKSATEKTIFMKKADWEKWDKALRSGKYQQGRYALQPAQGGFCCLGVLQQCLTGKVEREDNGESRGVPTTEWLEKHNIRFTGGGRIDSNLVPYLPLLKCAASIANDTRGNDFIEIADAVKEAVEFTD